MSLTFAPYLNFPGTARAALDFYADVLGGTVQIFTFAEFGNADPAVADLVMHATFTAEGVHFFASDQFLASDKPAGEPKVGTSLALFGDEPGDLPATFARLADGGEITMPLAKQVWGDTYGQLVDRFGVEWMVDFREPGDAAPEG